MRKFPVQCKTIEPQIYPVGIILEIVFQCQGQLVVTGYFSYATFPLSSWEGSVDMVAGCKLQNLLQSKLFFFLSKYIYRLYEPFNTVLHALWCYHCLIVLATIILNWNLLTFLVSGLWKNFSPCTKNMGV